MCGITGVWAIESIPDESMIEVLLKYGELRGTDSFGYSIYNCEPFRRIFENKMLGTERVDISANNIVRHMKKGSILIGNHRAIPETEELSLTDNNIQPITDPYDYTYKLALSHNGSVSSRIVGEFKLSSAFQSFTDIDSEAILFAYLKNNRNMKKTMEYLSGGFAFIMLDGEKRKLYSVCTHNPLYCGYIRGLGMIFSSFKEAIYEVISLAKGTRIERQNISVWEDYYVRELPEYTIVEFDIDSKLINETKFIPRYIHPNYDPYIENRKQKEKVLVSASGGLDSTTTLAILKATAYDIMAVHFKYGHRGGDAEELAIKNICKILNIPLIIFDITKDMKILDSNSMLTNKDHEITTGTDKDLKTTIAWTCFRNGLFTSYMGALAESFIITEKYTKVYITGGYLNLTESGVYPDNSERFMNSFIGFARFASIVGTMIEPLYCCSNLLKCEQYFLLDKMGLLDKIGEWLVSCDRPVVIDNAVYNCLKDGKPACGSGLLSSWASKLAGIKDPRKYYSVEDDSYKSHEHKKEFKSKDLDIYNIVDKLLIPNHKKGILIGYNGGLD
jgi:7-cyano-7-deazaguanine synthase in queuosine biosynthesis